MVLLPESKSGHENFKETWKQLKEHCNPLLSGGDGKTQPQGPIDILPIDFDAPTVSKLLVSIKNSLVGSRVRKIMTMNDPNIAPIVPVLARILELNCEWDTVIKLKIEASAVVGLLCLPEDQTVLGLLAARFPSVIIRALKNVLSKTSIETMVFHPTQTTQVQQHLLRTFLRTLSSLYSIIQDVSSTRKWGYMVKSPERVHHPQPGRVSQNVPHSVPSSVNSPETDRFDLKGKAKASPDAGDDMSIDSLGSHHLGVEDNNGLTHHFWLPSKRNQLKERCEYAKIILTKYLAQDRLIPLILAISPSFQSSTPDAPARMSLCSTADIVVPCFQLIWLLCKDTRRQIWLIRQLMEARDPITNEDSLLKGLVGCLKSWLASNHDHAIESSIRAIGALLSIDEPPHGPKEHELLAYLDTLIWAKSDADSADDINSWGIGWILLTCRAKDGSPILRAALATSSVCLVKNFPDIRLRILKLQLYNAIALIDNAAHSFAVRAEAAYALAHAVTVSETLQMEATEVGAIPVLKRLLDRAAEPPFPYSTPIVTAEIAMLRESAYLALASLMSTLDIPRQEFIDLNLLPSIVKSLEDESILVKASACQCCRALSRAISVLRTKLADEGAGSRLFHLAFGDEMSDESEKSDDEDEEAVEIQLKTVAMGALCNLVLDFSPMKQEVLDRNGINKFIKLLKTTKHQSLRVAALWGLKNMTFSSSTELKLKIVGTLGWDDIYKLLEDKNPAIQENMISLLRNVACGDVADVEIIFRQLNAENELMALLEDRLTSISKSMNSISSSLNESIVLQTMYTISNIATGNETHKNFVLGRRRTMASIFELMSHDNPEIKIGAIWCVINLTHWDESTDAKTVTKAINSFELLGVITKLNELAKDSKSDVRERAECALNQIRKRRKL